MSALDGLLASCRRLYHHVTSNGTLTGRDMGRIVEALENMQAREARTLAFLKDALSQLDVADQYARDHKGKERGASVWEIQNAHVRDYINTAHAELSGEVVAKMPSPRGSQHDRR
jgi:hypothetical protein